jgi:hypothetical protein
VTTKGKEADKDIAVAVHSTLVEQTTGQAINAEDLRLRFVSENGGTKGPVSLPPNQTSHLELCTGAQLHGKYKGNVFLVSAQKPEGESILTGAQFSSFSAKLLGSILILLGVFVAWWVKIWSRSRIDRDQVLAPAALLQSQVEELRQVLANLPATYRGGLPQIENWITVLLEDLSPPTLDGQHFLPPSFPSPYGFTLDTAAYTAYLKIRNDKAEFLSILVREGVLPVTAEDKGTLTPDQQQLVKGALTNIDNLTATTPMPGPDAALTKVNNELILLRKALLPPLPPAALVLGQANNLATQTAAREYQTLRLEVENISKGVWLIYGLLTTLSGLALLILSNPGFGIPVDFIFAFFWGFGLPTTLQSLPTGSVANALNIQIATPTAPRPAGPPPPPAPAPPAPPPPIPPPPVPPAGPATRSAAESPGA